MRERWRCPDLGPHGDGLYMPIPGSHESFPDCPAYYLRDASMGLPADHLIDGVTHPAQLVGEWAFEVEQGARNVESLSPKGRELVHVFLRERRDRDANDRELAKAKG